MIIITLLINISISGCVGFSLLLPSFLPPGCNDLICILGQPWPVVPMSTDTPVSCG